MATLIRYGRFEPLVPPEEAAAHLLVATTAPAPTNRIVGGPETAVAELDHLVAATGADEIMVTGVAYGLDVRLRSLELLAKAWPSSLPAPPGDELVEGDAGG
jgi:alkanesulfonate monooxygenase SsuD/methylene tetrahydromethanopterin reductase-like flavin-dependent oxidoreductase (luciferase family)